MTVTRECPVSYHNIASQHGNTKYHLMSISRTSWYHMTTRVIHVTLNEEHCKSAHETV